MRTALQSLPSSLEGAYEQLMQRIKSQANSHAELALRVIAIIRCACQPLEIGQLQEALAIQPGDEDVDEEDKPLEELLLSVCLGLVVSTDGPHRRKLIVFGHYTAMEFLNARPSTLTCSGDELLALACLTRLMMNIKTVRPAFYPSTLPLSEYAGSHWGDHVRLCENEEITELAFTYLSSSRGHFRIRQATIPFHYADFENHGLHVACSFGLLDITQRLLSRGDDVNTPGASGWPPLYHAILNNFAEIVTLLLDRGAHFGIALLIGIFSDHHEMVVLLLARGVGIEYDKASGPPLSYAVRDNQVAIARSLLENGANPDERMNGSFTTSDQTALHLAVQLGHFELVKLFLEWEANTQLKDASGNTPLQVATKYGYSNIASLLEAKAGNVLEVAEAEPQTICPLNA